MELFQVGHFTLASGASSSYKIECDAITPAGWEAIAAIAVRRLRPFYTVVGVPRGGRPFAAALRKYESANPNDGLLIAEDVVTTGGSVRKYRAYCDENMAAAVFGVQGVCLFYRPPAVRGFWRSLLSTLSLSDPYRPRWVVPIFTLTPER